MNDKYYGYTMTDNRNRASMPEQEDGHGGGLLIHNG